MSFPVFTRTARDERWGSTPLGWSNGIPLPRHEPGSLFGPKFGRTLLERAPAVAAAALHRHSDMRRHYGIYARVEQVPLPQVVVYDVRAPKSEIDGSSRLYVNLELFVQDVTDELPERPRPGVRFLVAMDTASQSRFLPSGFSTRHLRPQATHHTVTSATIEGKVLRRFDSLIERAILFGGRETLEGERF